MRQTERPEFGRIVLSSAQMRETEHLAMASGAVTGLALMEHAGRGIVDAILTHWPVRAAAGGAALVLCGPGNNGGDGYVVARHLAGWGFNVRCFVLGGSTGDAAAMREAWQGDCLPLEALSEADLTKAPLVVDALFGIGLGRALPDIAQGALARVQAAGCDIVAVDILSGVCADSGRWRGSGRSSGAGRWSGAGPLPEPVALTVSFETAKPGHFLAEGAMLSGALRIVPLGLERFMPQPGPDLLRLSIVQPAILKTAGHKFSHGHALVLAGGVGKGGAARLAARGALRIGAGLATIACPPAALQENAARLDAVMLTALKDADALEAMLQDMRIGALCLGPGLGQARARVMVPIALAAQRATALDADALSAYADAPGALFTMLHARCVLTPHGGEFARLFPDLAEALDRPATDGPLISRIDAVRAAARRAGCVVLLKGPDTVIAAPDGTCRINGAIRENAAPWLATAGAGDVLAGFITGLLARGFAPLEAAEQAAWLHVAAARQFGPGLIAEDLPEALPGVLRALVQSGFMRAKAAPAER